MIEEPAARELAKVALESDEVVLGDARELREGWFFPCIAKKNRLLVGVVINKTTGRDLLTMSIYPLERTLELYHLGYQFLEYDVVIADGRRL